MTVLTPESLGQRASAPLSSVVYPKLALEDGHVVYREYTDPPGYTASGGIEHGDHRGLDEVIEQKRRWALDGGV